MLDHQSYQLVVRKLALPQFELLVDGLARAQKLAWREAHLRNQLAQLCLPNRLKVVVDLLEVHAALTEQPVCLAALRSSRLLVDGYLVVQSLSSYGKIPRTLVASATRLTATT